MCPSHVGQGGRPPPTAGFLRAPRWPGSTVGRYLAAQIAQPFSATMLIVLPALLLERLLRMFDLIATRSVPGGAVIRMLLDLVPQYLGLALPAALFIGVFSVVARLGAQNELDAMQNAGFSLRWISRPFLAMGILAAIAGLGLYGYAQPYARYAYRAAFDAATEGAWNATITAGEMTRVSANLVVTADRSDAASGRLGGVVIYQHEPDGAEKITTARTGQLTRSPDGTQLLLTLQHGTRLDTQPDQTAGWLTSPSTELVRPFVLPVKTFRPRGSDEREMTLGELWRARELPNPFRPRPNLDGELHGRIVRSLSLAVLPLLALPFGLAAKRTRRQYGIVVGILILVLYYQAMQLAQSFGVARLADPRSMLWGIFLAFTALSLFVFRRAERHTAEGPLDALFDGLDRGLMLALGAWRTVRARVP